MLVKGSPSHAASCAASAYLAIAWACSAIVPRSIEYVALSELVVRSSSMRRRMAIARRLMRRCSPLRILMVAFMFLILSSCPCCVLIVSQSEGDATTISEKVSGKRKRPGDFRISLPLPIEPSTLRRYGRCLHCRGAFQYLRCTCGKVSRELACSCGSDLSAV